MIKKLIYGMACLAVFASCSDAGQDLAEPQTNPQGELITFGDGSVSEVGVIDLATIPDGQDSVQVCTIVAPTVSDASYTPEYTITLGDATYGINADGQMSVSELTSYVTATYGKRPTQRDITATLNRWASNGTTTVKLSSSPFTVKVIPEAPFIDESYYIVGSLDGWTCTRVEDYKMTNGGGDVYDDPVFSVTIPSPGAGTVEIKVIPQSAFNADGTIANWNIALSAQNPVNEGHFDYSNAGGNISFEATADAKFYKIEFNLMEGTYTITPISFTEYIYEIGNESSWSTNHALYGANADGKYQGYYYLNGQFKFKPNANNWDGDYEYDGEGKLTQTGSDNIPDPGAGFYQIDVDLANLTYALTKVNYISAIGDFNSWGGDVDLTYNTATGAWEASNVALSGGVKFRMNHEWAVSWGGNGSGTAYDDLTQNNGANLSVEDGTYDIQLFISYEGANKVVFTKK